MHHGAGQDHPRSRGVYRAAGHPFPTHLGSSPLARGLRMTKSVGRIEAGIIPARAGFTHPTFRYFLGRKDHPRSRGVYPRQANGQQAIRGSSPLARGLPELDSSSPREYRIIPARAGFTSPHPTYSPNPSDHPRSRGVYLPGRAGHGDLDGSSPLARGLRYRGPRGRADLGIIPARAGFTPIRRFLEAFRADHPRSRGVYFGLDEDSRIVDGSSPLARGLRDRDVAGLVLERIIPARAGFTLKTEAGGR